MVLLVGLLLKTYFVHVFLVWKHTQFELLWSVVPTFLVLSLAYPGQCALLLIVLSIPGGPYSHLLAVHFAKPGIFSAIIIGHWIVECLLLVKLDIEDAAGLPESLGLHYFRYLIDWQLAVYLGCIAAQYLYILAISDTVIQLMQLCPLFLLKTFVGISDYLWAL
jgi:hypothetical protein